MIDLHNAVAVLDSVKAAHQGRVVLDIPRLAIESNKIYAIVGENGSGKTTLLQVLNLMMKPVSGSIAIFGADTRSLGFNMSDARRRMTMVSQDPYLFAESVEKNISYGLSLRGIAGDDARRRTESALEAFGLRDKKGSHAHRLSGGEARRVALARAFALDVDLMLLDECTANLDGDSISVIESALKRLRREERATTVLTTHDYSFALKVADVVMTLENGRMVSRPVENVFKGRITRKGGTASFAVEGTSVAIEVISEREGECVAIVPPADITLSRRPIESSARNMFRGVVRGVEKRKSQVNVHVDIGAGLSVLITEKSSLEMGIGPGVEVFAVFKVSSVRVE